MAQRYRPRKEFKFWLFHDLTADVRLMEYITYLRSIKRLTQTLRDGLRLMWTLGEGDLSVLFELFPTLRVQLQPDNTYLIEQFREMLKAQQPLTTPHLQQPGAFKRVEPPREDEDTIIIRTDANADQRGLDNFMKAAFGIAGQTYTPPIDDDDDDNLPPPLPKGAMQLHPMR